MAKVIVIIIIEAAQDYFNRRKRNKEVCGNPHWCEEKQQKERGKGLGVRVMRGAQAMVYSG